MHDHTYSIECMYMHARVHLSMSPFVYLYTCLRLCVLLCTISRPPSGINSYIVEDLSNNIQTHMQNGERWTAKTKMSSAAMQLLCLYVCVCMCARMYVCTCVHLCMCVHVCMCVCVHLCVCVCVMPCGNWLKPLAVAYSGSVIHISSVQVYTVCTYIYMDG